MGNDQREPGVVLDPGPAVEPAFPAHPGRRRLLAFGAVLLALIGLGSTRGAREHAKAAVLMARFADVGAVSGLVRWANCEVDETDVPVDGPDGTPVRARMYVPRNVEHPPAIVMAHGVHRLGIDEPRLVRFARSIASTGAVVLTPELQDLADYRIETRSVAVLGASAHALRGRMANHRVGLMGMSFAGGLCLLAAAGGPYADDVGFVVAIGAHDDLGRVLHFFATNTIAAPDGRVVRLSAHPYGALVLAYGFVERFFAPEDTDAAREALRLWLWEKHDEARKRAEALGPGGQATMKQLFDGDIGAVTKTIEQLASDPSAMASVSPHGKIGALRVPVFLLHGAGDTVIPAVETEWIASELPNGVLRQMLVSPAIVHVELDHRPTLAQSWALVDFMASILDQADLDAQR